MTAYGHTEQLSDSLGMSPYKMVYGKACPLPVELEHKAYWVTRMLKMNLEMAGKKRMFQLKKLEEFC